MILPLGTGPLAGSESAGASGSVIDSGSVTLGLSISVVSPQVFSTATGSIRWAPTVTIGAVGVSTRLTGALRVTAAEDAARVATLSLIPALAADLDSYEGQAITIDVTLFRTGQTATYRLFTGLVERSEYDPSIRIVALSCRDGWQERPSACASAAEIEALLGGLATPSAALLPWLEAKPDPGAYFSGLLDTLPGATAINSSGLWQVIPWEIGSPAATFAAGDVFDGSLQVNTAARADVPAAIKATLAVRTHRLHAAEVNLAWEAVNFSYYILDGLPVLPKSTVSQALASVSGWLIKGTPTLIEPTPGTYGPIGGAYYIVWPEMARTTCQSFTATLYRRWYQETEVTYGVTVDMGGASSRDDSINASIASNFDGSAWETAPSEASVNALYRANAPTVVTPPTGYEGLPEPWPPTNGAVDHPGNIAPADLQAAVQQVVARAMRRAALGKRKRTVRFARPLDPRWELGSVLAVTAQGVAATGQVSEIEHELDLDSGALSSAFTLAVPEGNDTTTGYTASVTAPGNTIVHALTDPDLDNRIGASTTTPADPDEDTLQGFLCNAVPAGTHYDPDAPVYQEQFRIVMPGISALVRDPLKIEEAITASISLAAGSLVITF